MTQQDGANPPDGQSDPATQRERRWPPVADADWWRDETTEYVPVRRTLAGPSRDPARDPSGDPSRDPSRDPEIDFELDAPGDLSAPGDPSDASAAAARVSAAELRESAKAQPPAAEAVPEAAPETAPEAAPEGAEAAPHGAPAEARSASPWAIGAGAEWTAAPEPETPGPIGDATGNATGDATGDATEAVATVDTPDGAEAAADGDGDGDGDEAESTGIGRSASPYARPPRITRREVAPTPRRVLPIPPAIITAPTPATSPESIVEAPPTELVEVAESLGLSLFDPTEVGALPTLPRPRRPPAPPPVTRRRKRVRRPRPGRAWIGLPALLVLLIAAAFVAWVSAEPFWLDTGHGTIGTATVVAKTDRCRVTFAAAGGGFTTSTVDLAGAELDQCAVGATVAAQMVSADAARAYAVDRTGLRLRWAVGLAGLLLCGWGIAWATGAARFRGLQRVIAITLSLGAPLLVAATMLAVTY